MKKKIIFSSFAVVVLAGAAVLFFGNSNSSKDEALPKVKVKVATIVDKALAVGTIEPEIEISVKSKVSGVVKHLFVDVGQFVKAGQPLVEIRPDPTPIELADAKRQVQFAQVDVDNLKTDRTRQEITSCRACGRDDAKPSEYTTLSRRSSSCRRRLSPVIPFALSARRK